MSAVRDADRPVLRADGSARVFRHHCYTDVEAQLMQRDARRAGAAALRSYFSLIAVISFAGIFLAITFAVALGIALGLIAFSLLVELAPRLDASRELSDLRSISTRKVRRMRQVALQVPELAYALDRWEADRKVLRLRDYKAVLSYFTGEP